MGSTSHPYMPPSRVLPWGYEPPTHYDRVAILGVFFAIGAFVMVAAWMMSSPARRKLVGIASSFERFLFSWFIFTGLVHFVIEGSFAAYLRFPSDTGKYGIFWTFMADLWKEYSMADSRCAHIPYTRSPMNTPPASSPSALFSTIMRFGS